MLGFSSVQTDILRSHPYCLCETEKKVQEHRKQRKNGVSQLNKVPLIRARISMYLDENA